MQDKTEIEGLIWVYRLRQGSLFASDLTCGALGAPWECEDHDPRTASGPTACETRRKGHCSAAAARTGREELPPVGNTGVTRPDTAPAAEEGSFQGLPSDD